MLLYTSIVRHLHPSLSLSQISFTDCNSTKDTGLYLFSSNLEFFKYLFNSIVGELSMCAQAICPSYPTSYTPYLGEFAANSAKTDMTFSLLHAVFPPSYAILNNAVTVYMYSTPDTTKRASGTDDHSSCGWEDFPCLPIHSSSFSHISLSASELTIQLSEGTHKADSSMAFFSSYTIVKGTSTPSKSVSWEGFGWES